MPDQTKPTRPDDNDKRGQSLPDSPQKDSKIQPQSARPEHVGADANAHRSNQFDGNPTPAGDDSGLFKPKDDTPAVLEKRSGPKPA